jgi:hypothetical protein
MGEASKPHRDCVFCLGLARPTIDDSPNIGASTQ